MEESCQYIIYPSALVSEESILGCDEWSATSAPWLWWRGKPSAAPTWSKRWKRESWILALSTRTYCGSLGRSIEEWWTSSRAASHVSLSVRPGFASRPKTTVTSGPTSKQGLLFSDLESASSRTSKELQQPSHPDTTPFSTMSSATWKKWVTAQRQDALVRRKSAHLIDESVGLSLAWPTPTPIHAIRGNHDEPVENYQKRVKDYEEGRAKGKPGKSLGVAVNLTSETAEGSPRWATPTSRDWKDRGPNTDYEAAAKKRRLAGQVNWPTPTVAEGGKVSNSPNFGQKALSNHPEIQGEPDREVRAKPVAGQPDPEKRSTFGKSQGLLNPAWVEQLMNFPVGWTDCEAWATQSCQR